MTEPTTTTTVADFVISVEELAEWERPFVATVGGRILNLKNVNAFSLDDYFALAEQADEDPRPIISQIANDPETVAGLRALGQKALTVVLQAWFRSVGVTPGEPERSES